MSRLRRKNVESNKLNLKWDMFSWILQSAKEGIQTESAAIYLRLSRDDGGPESESIGSQRMLLMQFAESNGIAVLAEFTDDGISGSRFDRSGFQEMLRAIEDGWIHTVLVKDLSRLSRDYIRTGELIERWFPAHGVRLIAVNDGLDTGKQASSADFTAMRAVMDDWYARDISCKVRAAVSARQKAGICTAPRLPFGYYKSGGAIRIAEAVAETVRKIFRAFASGGSCNAIAAKLTAEQIPPPSGAHGAWNDTAVRRILLSTAYIGKLRLHSTSTYSYKCRKRIRLPENDAIFFPVPAIISHDLFFAAQRRMQASSHTHGTKHWLSGRAFCGLCGSRMILAKEREMFRMICSTRKHGGSCPNPSMKTDALFSLLAPSLRKAGIEADAAAYPLLIARTVVGETEIHVFLRYALPDSDASV